MRLVAKVVAFLSLGALYAAGMSWTSPRLPAWAAIGLDIVALVAAGGIWFLIASAIDGTTVERSGDTEVPEHVPVDTREWTSSEDGETYIVTLQGVPMVDAEAAINAAGVSMRSAALRMVSFKVRYGPTVGAVYADLGDLSRVADEALQHMLEEARRAPSGGPRPVIPEWL